MKKGNILIIDQYKAGNEFLRQSFLHMGKNPEEIHFAINYEQAQEEIARLKGSNYGVLSESHIPTREGIRIETSGLLESLSESNIPVVLHTADNITGLGYRMNELIFNGKIWYVQKTAKNFEDDQTFYHTIILPLINHEESAALG
jgi:hypothetical protein